MAPTATAPTSTPTAPSPTLSGSGLWSCVAQHEEGGSNSWAGYFGMISPPADYPGSAAIVAEYGDNWLAIPYAAQVVIAEAELASQGPGAWAPTTRAYCWPGY